MHCLIVVFLVTCELSSINSWKTLRLENVYEIETRFKYTSTQEAKLIRAAVLSLPLNHFHFKQHNSKVCKYVKVKLN